MPSNEEYTIEYLKEEAERLPIYTPEPAVWNTINQKIPKHYEINLISRKKWSYSIAASLLAVMLLFLRAPSTQYTDLAELIARSQSLEKQIQSFENNINDSVRWTIFKIDEQLRQERDPKIVRNLWQQRIEILTLASNAKAHSIIYI